MMMLLSTTFLLCLSMQVMFRPEDLRPQFHFTAPKGWLNDPNGLVYREGMYHLFYQHNPFGTEWGNMTWGHAVSTDLIHWKHRPNALEPDDLGTIFSGPAVVDTSNAAGFGKSAIVCFYTAAGGTNKASEGKPFTQCLAWSTDGEVFHKLKENPVVPHLDGENRDPKVVWHQESKQWVMALYLSGDSFCLLGSKNLREWTELSRLHLKGASECPDFFELPIDGDRHERRWVFWAANGDYQVGRFDGRTFKPETEVLKSTFGNTGYAAQTYSNAPKSRRIQIAWLNGSNFKGCPWNQQLGFPNVLSLRSTKGGPRLAFWPIDEIKRIRHGRLVLDKGEAESTSGLLDFEGEWQVPNQGSLELSVNGRPITVDAASGVLSAMGSEIKLDLSVGRLSLRLLVDRASVELYAQSGLVHAAFFVLPIDGAKRGMSVRRVGAWAGRRRCTNYVHDRLRSTVLHRADVKEFTMSRIF
ncbi:MAG: glycoside hydrolase family 32 protein [Nitrospiraceae bacterium]